MLFGINTMSGFQSFVMAPGNRPPPVFHSLNGVA
jgi:hypothetical protein